MKKLLFAGFNFGKKYETYLPIYAYSILKAYPEYEVALFTDVKLSENTHEMIDLVSAHGRIHLFEDYDFGIEGGLSSVEHFRAKTACRWVLFEEMFLDYKAVYIGDIDMFICREFLGIFEQHEKHCTETGLPYSNDVRWQAKQLSASLESEHSEIVEITSFPRMTGLHYVHPVEYFGKVLPLFPGRRKLLTSNSGLVQDDENFLFNLIRDSGLEIVPAGHGGEVYACTKSSYSFRPHHGLHLGLFRSKNGVLAGWNHLSSGACRNYFAWYASLLSECDTLKKLISLSDPFVSEQFERMELFYSQLDTGKVSMSWPRSGDFLALANQQSDSTKVVAESTLSFWKKMRARFLRALKLMSPASDTEE